MYPYQLPFARLASSRLMSFAICIALVAAPPVGAQAPAASGTVAQAPAPADLENLVAPIALYPDDLVALVLPASTNPLQVVQADRFLDKRKQDPKLQVDQDWDDSVKSLVNYPEIIKKMSTDLDWTAALGEAVVANQVAVLDAVQGFRRKAQSAGNLKSDQKQVVVVEKEIIKIEPANPQVIYVPQYNPTTVVAYSPYPAYGYYPYAYPSYYYPYAPGAALATGLIWGAAMGAIWSGARYGTSWGGGNNNITVNRNTNINSSNVRSARASQGTAWKSDKRPGQVRSGAGSAQTASRFSGSRPGDPAGGARAGGAGQQRAGGVQDSRQAGAADRSRDGGAGERSGGLQQGTRQADAGGARERGGERGGDRAGGAQGSRQDAAGGSRAGSSQQFGGGSSRSQASGGGGASQRNAFSGYSSGGGARADSSRGAASRGGMSHGGGRAGGRGGGGRGR
jgi:hypothetical protein